MEQEDQYLDNEVIDLGAATSETNGSPRGDNSDRALWIFIRGITND